MSLPTNIIDYFPSIVPRGTVEFSDEAHTFRVRTTSDGDSAPKTVYTPRKAPFTRIEDVRATVDGKYRSLERGVEYEARDTDEDGQYDAIAFIDKEAYPDERTEFEVDYVAPSLISRYTESHTEDLDQLSDELDIVVDSHQLQQATGSDLDRIGSLFGDLGRRRGRSDEEYRAILRSITQSFNGRGTIPGMRFAVSVAVDTDIENIEVVEYFDQVGYEVNIKTNAVNKIPTSLISIIERSGPSGVELLRPPLVATNNANIGVKHGGTTVSSTTEGDNTTLGSGTLNNGKLG